MLRFEVQKDDDDALDFALHASCAFEVATARDGINAIPVGESFRELPLGEILRRVMEAPCNATWMADLAFTALIFFDSQNRTLKLPCGPCRVDWIATAFERVPSSGVLLGFWAYYRWRG